MSDELVLVTGGSGFIAAHCILQLLEAGYKVRTTVRTASKEDKVRDMLKTGGADPGDRLSFAAADLTSDEGWGDAAAGCTYVLHVASPFPPKMPKSEDDIIVPARDGALRVLRAARDAGVKRLVLTSSFAAIGYGRNGSRQVFSEEDWTDPDGRDVDAYIKSKTLAERAAWEFIGKEGRTLELAVINPVGVLGPVLGPDYSYSIQIVQRLLDGEVPGLPRLAFGIVDVRDVADLHLRAMTAPSAKGERFIAVAGDFMPIRDIAEVLKKNLGESASRVPTKTVSDFILRIAALFDPTIRQVIPQLGKIKKASNEKARNLLGWQPRSNVEAIVAAAESLVNLGIVGSFKEG